MSGRTAHLLDLIPPGQAGIHVAEQSDPRLGHALDYMYETVAANDDGGVQPTYDLSVPSNVTYVAAGFVSHNTIGFLMDCDTTGIEPDIAIVKYKNLVGGGVMKIVNTTVPESLARLGYSEAPNKAIIACSHEHDALEGAPGPNADPHAIFPLAV